MDFNEVRFFSLPSQCITTDRLLKTSLIPLQSLSPSVLQSNNILGVKKMCVCLFGGISPHSCGFSSDRFHAGTGQFWSFPSLGIFCRVHKLWPEGTLAACASERVLRLWELQPENLSVGLFSPHRCCKHSAVFLNFFSSSACFLSMKQQNPAEMIQFYSTVHTDSPNSVPFGHVSTGF